MTDKSKTHKPHNTNSEDLTGQRFEHLVALERVPDSKPTKWLCKCDCGKTVKVSAYALKKGQHSCGCMTKQILREYRTTHGGSKTKLFNIWKNMKDRCYQQKHKSYVQYGGRGIKVCDEWLNDFGSFQKWAYENGYDEKAGFMKCTIDRIDVNGNYEPDNCRWVDMKVQCNNRTNSRILTFNGESHTVMEWSDITNIPYDVIHSRIDKWHWSVEKALTTSNNRFDRSIHKKVLDYLMCHEIVDADTAKAELNLETLGSAVSKLRKLGYEIESESNIARDDKGKLKHIYTTYKLVSIPQEKEVKI